MHIVSQGGTVGGDFGADPNVFVSDCSSHAWRLGGRRKLASIDSLVGGSANAVAV